MTLKTPAEIAMAHDRLLLLARGGLPGSEPLEGHIAGVVSMAVAALSWAIGQDEPEFAELLSGIDEAFDNAGLEITVQPEAN